MAASARSNHKQLLLMAIGLLAANAAFLVIVFSGGRSSVALLAPWSGQPYELGPRWKAVHVYVGDPPMDIRHDERLWADGSIPAGPNWHSQAEQDQAIVRIFRGKRAGYFVDLAANAAVKLSNSLALERDFGWHGLCIEPNPIYWYGLAHRRCDVVAGVVGDTENQIVEIEVHAMITHRVFSPSSDAVVRCVIVFRWRRGGDRERQARQRREAGRGYAAHSDTGGHIAAVRRLCTCTTMHD